MSKTIRLFWWNEVVLMKKKKENYGDLLGKYLVEKISKKTAVWTLPKKFSVKNYFQPIYVTIGSILGHVTKNCIVWGSGIIAKDHVIAKAKFLAVRGPQTRKHLISQGFDVPEIYGDPALLLPDFYFPLIEKKYKFGVIPHYNDYKSMSQVYKDQQDILVIDLMTDDIETVTNLFLQCEKIVSTSLHGLIVSHAYRIPAVWIQFSDKLFGDGIKFQDYFESVEMKSYIPTIKSDRISKEEMEQLFNENLNLPDQNVVNKLKDGLMRVCPFR